MPPIQSGSIVIGKAVSDIDQLKLHNRYIFVSKSEGILFKRLGAVSSEKSSLILSSDNLNFDLLALGFEEVMEIWSFYMFVGYPDAYPSPLSGLSEQVSRLEALTEKLSRRLNT